MHGSMWWVRVKVRMNEVSLSCIHHQHQMNKQMQIGEFDTNVTRPDPISHYTSKWVLTPGWRGEGRSVWVESDAVFG